MLSCQYVYKSAVLVAVSFGSQFFNTAFKIQPTLVYFCEMIRLSEILQLDACKEVTTLTVTLCQAVGKMNVHGDILVRIKNKRSHTSSNIEITCESAQKRRFDS